MASPAIHQRSPHPSSPLQKLSTFKTASTPNQSPLDTFSSDPIFSLFLSPSFSSTRFSSSALSSGSSASTAEKLQHGIHLLETQLRSEVLSRHTDLLSQLSSLSSLSLSLSSVKSSISSLQSSLAKLRSEISSPHGLIHSQTTQLTNLHATSQLLQHAIRALRLSDKLRDELRRSDKLDLAKAAQLYCEIQSLIYENELNGIDLIDEELVFVSEAGSKLRNEAMRVLENGLSGFNQAEVGTGLQVFYNMGELRMTVDGMISKYKNQGVKSISVALDMKAITGSGGNGFGPGGVRGSGTPQIGGGSKAKEAFWQRMGVCMDQLHLNIVAVWHLQRVLSKKRDPFKHVLLLDEVMQVSE